MLNEFLIVILGCVVVVFLAHFVIKKNIDIAEHFGLSGTFIGMTILSIGTSLPEILTDLAGSIQILKDNSLMNTVSGLVLGTNIGSDIFQQNFILAIVAILGTVTLLRKHLWPMMGGLIGATAVLLIFGFNGLISRTEGLLLVGGYLLYLIYLKRKGLNDHIKPKNHLDRKGLILTTLLLLGSFAVMALAANEILKASEVLVEALPVSASFFGIIVIGIAAALPELTTALVALKKHRKGMSAGVLIGSNITNPTFALGLGAMVSTYVVPKVIVWYDLPVKILGSLLIFWFLWKNKGLGKKEAVVLIGMFLVYLIVRSMFFPVDF
jgi:cation:H+ antiporter